MIYIYADRKYPSFSTSTTYREDALLYDGSDIIDDILYNESWEYENQLAQERKPLYDKIYKEIDKLNEKISILDKEINDLVAEDDDKIHEYNKFLLKDFKNRHPELMI
jgi:hypothetical protein